MHDITDYLRSQIADLTQVVLESLCSTHQYSLNDLDTKRENMRIRQQRSIKRQHRRGSLRFHKLGPARSPALYKKA